MSRLRHGKRNLDGKFTPCMRNGGAVRNGATNIMKSASSTKSVKMEEGQPMKHRLDRKCGGAVKNGDTR
jgi:hypothetical protein